MRYCLLAALVAVALAWLVSTAFAERGPPPFIALPKTTAPGLVTIIFKQDTIATHDCSRSGFGEGWACAYPHYVASNFPPARLKALGLDKALKATPQGKEIDSGNWTVILGCSAAEETMQHEAGHWALHLAHDIRGNGWYDSDGRDQSLDADPYDIIERWLNVTYYTIHENGVDYPVRNSLWLQDGVAERNFLTGKITAGVGGCGAAIIDHWLKAYPLARRVVVSQ